MGISIVDIDGKKIKVSGEITWKKRFYYFIMSLIVVPFLIALMIFIAMFILVIPILALVYPEIMFKVEPVTEE